jgi:UDP-N-acetyl-D-mannosaminuronate dehydrogenase
VIAALGLAYKPDIDDLRESPAVEIVKLLRDAGADVHIHEPFNLDYSIKGVKTARTLKKAVTYAEIILLLVGHSQLKEINPAIFAENTKARFVFDMVNGWDGNSWQSARFTYFRLGDGKNN